jgi:hypothetical protein
MFKVKDVKYLAKKLGVTVEEFHRKVKPRIVLDFKPELNTNGITNPDIGLNEKNFIFLVDTNDARNYVITDLGIENYI